MIVLFDGVCNLCAKSIQFILPRDEKSKPRFAPLQSTYSRTLLKQFGLPVREPPDSIVLIHRGRAYTESDAALRILGALRFPWTLALLLLLVPKPIRDAIYRYLAGHRYAWFGQADQCWLPSPEWKGRFIDTDGERP